MSDSTMTTDVQEVAQVTNDYAAAIKAAISNGSIKRSNLKVRTVGVKKHTSDNGLDYATITLNLFGDGISAYVADEDGNYAKGKTKTIFSSSFAVSGIFKQDETLAWLAKDIVANPSILEVLLCGATIDVLATELSAGEVYSNPFSAGREYSYSHDTIVNEVINIRLSETGMEDVMMIKRAKLLKGI